MKDQTTLEHLEEAKRWLEEAIPLAKEASLNSLLQYYQVGYKSGTWHLPSIVSKYAHDLDLNFARLMNEVLKDTGFHLDEEEAENSGNFTLYFGGEPYPGDKSNFSRNKGRYIGSFDAHNRSVWCSTDFDDSIIKTKQNIEKAKNEILKLKEAKIEAEEWLKNHDNAVGRFMHAKKIEKYKNALSKSDDYIGQREQEAAKEIASDENQIEKYLAIKLSVPKLIDALHPRGFTFEGYFNRKEKKIAFYAILESDEKKKNDFMSTKWQTHASLFSSGGTYAIGKFLGFDLELFSAKDIASFKSEIDIKPHEVGEDQFLEFALKSKQASARVTRVMFDCLDEQPSDWLKSNLESAIEEGDGQSLFYALRSYRDEGYAVTEIAFEWNDCEISFNKSSRAHIRGEDVILNELIYSDPMQLLLGLKKE